MELLKLVRRRSFIHEVLYAALNIGLALTVVLVIQLTDSLFLAVLIILLSKWRVFAVRPRYWFVHVQSNLVDYIVSISVVMLMYLAHSSGAGDVEKGIILTVYVLAYIFWLLYVKPRSKRIYMHIQAGVALFLGTTALYSVAYEWPSVFVVSAMWLIGYAAARHILTSYEESNITLLSLIWGLITAEFGWMVYHWTVAYMPLGVETFSFPRAALTVLCIGLIAERAYDSLHKHDRIRTNDILMPVIFTLAIAVLLPIILSLLGPNVAIGF